MMNAAFMDRIVTRSGIASAQFRQLAKSGLRFSNRLCMADRLHGISSNGDSEARKAFMEEPMKSLYDLADNYDECAKAHEATAELVLAGLTSYADEIRERQLERADWLTAEATALRARAVELRKVEATIFD